MAIHERLWDHPPCGKMRIKGRYKFCPGCGGQRPTDVRFYKNALENDVVTDPDLLAQAHAGPDKTCLNCRQDNGGQEKFCGHCGAPMDEATPRPVVVQRLEEIPTSGDELVRPTAFNYEPRQTTYYPTQPASAGFDPPELLERFGPWALGLLLAAIVVVFGYFWLKTEDVPVKVSGFWWSRSISVEKFTTITEEGWSHPGDAKNIRSERRQNGSHKEQDGTETYTYQQPHQTLVGEEKCGEKDLGNGFAEDIMCPKYETTYTTETGTRPKYKDVPDYALWYTYEVDRWVFSRTASSSGNDHNAHDPALSLGSSERAAGKSESSYSASFSTKDGKTFQMPMSYGQWAGLTMGQSFNGKVNSFGVLIAIEPPK